MTASISNGKPIDLQVLHRHRPLVESKGSHDGREADARPTRTSSAPPPRSPATRSAPAASGAGVSTAQQRILDVLALLESYGIDVAVKEMVAAHAGVSPTSGGYFNNLGKLRTLGLVEYPQGGSVALTDSGRAAASQPDRPPTLAELHSNWLNIVPTAQAVILQRLIQTYPRSIAKDDLADACNVSRTSGGFFNNLGRLRTMGAITYPEKGTARAADILFPKAAP